MIITVGTISETGETVEEREVQDDYLNTPAPPLDALTQTQLAIAELAEAQEAAQTDTHLALAELAEMITGGVS